MLCAAPTVLIGLANAPAELRGRRAARRARGHRRRAAGRGDDRAHRGRARLDGHAGLRPDRDRAVHHRSASRGPSTTRSRRPSARPIKARQGVELITSGELRVVDDDGQRGAARRRRRSARSSSRGNVVMEGYYNDPEATASARCATAGSTRGDAAVVHPDGYVEIRDRLKDVIISGGENISSVEVEGVLLRHPAVQEVAVVGLPDEKWGEAPHAFVVLQAGRDGDRRGAARSSRATALAHFKAPHSVHVRRRAAEDGDRQDPEVRAAGRPRGDRPAVVTVGAKSATGAGRC